MTMNVQFLFGRPQQEIASSISDHLSRCLRASMVVGFATDDGLNAIAPGILAMPAKLETFVLGAATFRGFEVLERLAAGGIPRDRLFVHLGHTQPYGAGGSGFVKFHPMMHSKIYLMEHAGGRSAAFVGSHNLTHFAMDGKNGEASVLIEGPSDHPEFEKVRNHIAEARRQATQFDQSMKDGYAWWTTQFIDGLRREVNLDDEEVESTKTFVILAEGSSADKPRKRAVVYFEIPEDLGNFRSLANEVHIFVFNALPASPMEALQRLDEAEYSLWCKTEGLELGRGGVELQADWEISGRPRPVIRRTDLPFRPNPAAGMQQVRVVVKREVRGRFKYIFDVKNVWEPQYNFEEVLPASPEINLSTPGAPRRSDWRLVSGLRPVEPGTQKKREALQLTSPESGQFILYSMRRIDLDKLNSEDQADVR